MNRFDPKPIRAAGVCLLAVGLSACGALPEPRIDTAGVDESQLRADLEACEDIAREADIDGDLEIPGEDRPVAGGDRPGDHQRPGTGGAADSGVITEEQQLQRIIENCMADRGYRILD